MPVACMPRLLVIACALLALPLAAPSPAAAQQDFFIPGQSKQAAPGPSTRLPPRRAPAPPARVEPPPPPPPPVSPGPLSAAPEGQELPQAQQQLPPPPELPPLPKGASPPAAVIGVMGVPEVMRASSAAQQVEKIIGERREKLNVDAQKEQAVWRDMQQALVNDRGKLSAEQARARERELQERITNSQRTFRERGRIIQEAAQYALGQIERTLISVIRQVAESRGMNLVLHRQQVALNVNEFDITDQVAEQMNKILPTVIIPPDGVEPPTVPAPLPSVTLPPSASSKPNPGQATPAAAASAPATPAGAKTGKP
jgi:Skp family chaperone for outer membrane proteins